MPQPLVFRHSDPNVGAENLASYIVGIQNDVLATQSQFNVAVSGGSLVKSLRNGLLRREDVEWSKWRIFFSDERIVPLDSEDSNYGLVKKELLSHLNPDTHGMPAVFHLDDRISMNEKSSAFAESYARTLRDELPESDHAAPGNGIPRFDLVLLGCGPDGHTCSLFAGHELLHETSKTVAFIDDSPKPPAKRITITLPTLRAASAIAFMAEGDGKATVLAEILDSTTSHSSKLPCAIVNRSARNPVTWFIDDSAAKLLKL